MHAESRVVNAAASWLTAKIARETGYVRRIRINESRAIGEAIVAETTKALQEGPIDRSEFPVSAYPKVVRSRSCLAEKLKFVSTDVIRAEKWATVTFRRVAHREPDGFILWQNCEIKISKLRLGVVPVVAGDSIRGNWKAGKEPVRVYDVV